MNKKRFNRKQGFSKARISEKKAEGKLIRSIKKSKGEKATVQDNGFEYVRPKRSRIEKRLQCRNCKEIFSFTRNNSDKRKIEEFSGKSCETCKDGKLRIVSK